MNMTANVILMSLVLSTCFCFGFSLIAVAEEDAAGSTVANGSEVADQAEPADLFAGEIQGRVVVIKKQVEDKEEKTVYIIGKVSAKDESALDAASVAELRRLGRKRLEVVGTHLGEVETFNGKIVLAEGNISFSG